MSFGDLGGAPDDDVASSSNHVIAKQAKKSKSRFHRNVKRAVMKRMRVDYGVGVGDPTELAPGQRRDGAYMRR